MSKAQPPYGRRSFIRLTGMTAGALALGSFPSLTLASVPAPGPAVRLGVISFESNLLPSASESLLAGMRLYLDAAGSRQVNIASAHLAPLPGQALDRLSDWLARNPADAVVATVGSENSSELHKILASYDAVLIAADAGANIVREGEASPHIVYNTLGYWQANWAMGRWAAENLGRRAYMALSFYESGYDAPYAFRKGFESAGGEILASQVTHVPGSALGLPDVLDAIQTAHPDFVYAMYSGAQAVEFVQAYAAAGLGGIPLAASAFTVDEALLPAIGQAALGIKSALSWATLPSSAVQADFTARLASKVGRPADAFAALGFDTARLVVSALAAAQPDGWAASFREALAVSSFEGPRGPLAVDPITQQVRAPIYLREVRWQDGSYQNAALAELPAVSEPSTCMDDLCTAVRTGWLHPYLAV